MTPELQQRVRELAAGASVMLCTGVKAFRHRHTGRVVYMVKSNRPEMPNGATQITFETFDDAFALVRKLGITRKLPAYSDTSDIAQLIASPQPKRADNDMDAPIVDPLLNTLDDLHQAISDAVVDGDIATLKQLAWSYSQICDVLTGIIKEDATGL